MLSASAVCINKLRVTGHHRDPLALRLRLDRVLSATDFTPPELPATAIVCIKHLRDPRPGLLDLSASSMRSSLDWEQAVRQRLADLIARAPRTVQDRNAAAHSDCVIFFDKADLLASLAGDWCRGDVETRWWWHTLLRSQSISRELLALWRDAAEHIPAALERLGPERIEFVRKLADPDANELVAVVAQRFGLHALAPVLAAKPGVRVVARELEHVVERRTQLDRPGIAPSAPWQKLVADSSVQQLSVEQQRFLGVSLMLLHAPATVRTSSFASNVEQWQQEFLAFTEFAARSEVEPIKPAGQAPVKRGKSFGRVARTSKDLVSSLASSPNTHHDVSPQLSIDSSRGVVYEPQQPAGRRLTTRNQVVPQIISGPHDQSAAYSEPATVVEPPSLMAQAAESNTILADAGVETKTVPAQTIDPVDKTEAAIWREDASTEIVDSSGTGDSEAIVDDFSLRAEVTELIAEVETRFGGVFYLVNLGIYLGLYGDFSTPAEPGIDLNLWDFVALVGRELIGDQIEADPVWPLLARLSGREDDIGPSAGGGGSQRGSRGGDVHAPDRPVPEKSQLEKDDLKTWLGDLMPRVRRRLRLAFGLDETADPGPLLIAHVGMIRVTLTHIDVFFDLEELPIAIRLAGLDRDPGWVPAAGRFIAFHFN